MNVLILFPLRCCKRKLIWMRALSITVCLVLAVEHIYKSSREDRQQKRRMYWKGEGEFASSFTGTHQYLFTVENLSRNTILKSMAFLMTQMLCSNSVKPHQNSFILWRSGCDHMKEMQEEPACTVVELAAYFQWLPRSRKD